jgi:predicted CXXCH cytochrome family protein
VPKTAIAAVGVGLMLAAGFAMSGVRRDLDTERDLHGAEYATSAECRRCHEDHYASWHRTFHRTMTAEASEESVLGDFDGATLEYGGVVARFFRRDGRFFASFGEGPSAETVEVARTVGSHRYQQYLAKDDDLYFRLPVAWHVEERRWFHMNGAFLTPDPEPLDRGAQVESRDYHRHVVRWNDNCVFCHNVAPNPGRTGDRFETTVAELGVACEACHGPGTEHARLNRDPMRRYSLHLDEDESDPTIVNPAKLDPERSAEICGRCHGQRLSDRVDDFVAHGDPFVPGDDLSAYSEPLWQDTALGGEQGAFALRFWRDGTARLTAYEYQGLLQSPCAIEGDLTCTTCHGMHEGDPRGQMRASAIGDAACTRCHEELGAPSAASAHSGHRVESASCVSCHMPSIVYGLVSVHVSHRIETPDPARDAAHRRPDACTLCHLDRSRGWAAGAASPGSGSEVERALFAGDPIERAIAASAIGGPRTARDRGRDPIRIGLLLDVMERDPYPAVRRIAARSAAAIALVEIDYEATWDRPSRERAVERLRRELGGRAIAPDPRRLAALRAEAETVAIEIGE